MALSIIQLFSPVQLGTSSTMLYAAPTTPTTAVVKNGRIRLTNTSAVPVPVTLYVAPSATASAAANSCMSAQSIGGNAFLDVDVPTLAAGDTLRGLAGTASVITVHELGGVLFS
jgi:hypothetical protein